VIDNVAGTASWHAVIAVVGVTIAGRVVPLSRGTAHVTHLQRAGE
jgi:hypothetical protein